MYIQGQNSGINFGGGVWGYNARQLGRGLSN